LVAGTLGTSTVPTASIGQLGWSLAGTIGSLGNQSGGAPPNTGWFGWQKSGTTSAAGALQLNWNASNAFPNQAWALFDSPGWTLTWIFKFESSIGGTLGFNTAKRAAYIGLCDGYFFNTAGSVSRPAMFIGVRYDTSTSGASLNDSFLTLEVVENGIPSAYARINTQGSTLVTNVAPVAGVVHRLDISCSAVGKVTITLDGSSTNTLTASVSTVQVAPTAGNTTGTIINNVGHIQRSGAGTKMPFGAGSSVTVAGFGAPVAALNGTFNLIAVSSTDIWYINISGNAGPTSSGSQTMTGYPAFVPCAIFGNDDTAGNTTNNSAFYVDYFSFIWNPNLGPNAPGTPLATNPRYF